MYVESAKPRATFAISDDVEKPLSEIRPADHPLE